MGAAGDMLMGALYELCPDREGFLRDMNRLLPGVTLTAESVTRQGIAGAHMRVVVHGREEGHHHHDHDHEHHHHRSLGDIREMIGGFDLPQAVRDRAMEVYERIAQAESAAHGVAVGEVHFHEVGALDAVMDVTGVCYLMHLLAPEAVWASPVTVGSGTVRTAHGLLPVPAPATARLLEGVPVVSGDIAAELCTPTGAALLRAFAGGFGPMPEGVVRGCGYGYVSDRVAGMEHHKLLAKPEKEWELGTFPHPNFAAITAVVDYVCWLGGHFTDAKDRRALFVAGMNRIHLQEHSLLIHMMEGTPEVPGLRRIPGVTVYLDSADDVDRDLISAIGVDGLELKELVAEYYRRGVTVFERVNTSLYSKRIVESLGLTGAIRVSPLHCHDTGDIDQFLRVTAQIAAQFAQ